MGSKKDKKDKKAKKEKKSKKSSSKRSHKETRSANQELVPVDDLASVLNYSLLSHPGLMKDIPTVLKALDDGEFVDVNEVSDATSRELLTILMRYLPVLYNHGNGWYKETLHTKVTQYVLSQLEKVQHIKDGSELTMSESLASKNVMLKLMVLLETFPDLKGELGGLFATLLGGDAIQVDSLDNEDIRDGLEDIFRAIGLERTADGYSIPQGRKTELVTEALQHLGTVFESYEETHNRRTRAGSSSTDHAHASVINDNPEVPAGNQLTFEQDKPKEGSRDVEGSSSSSDSEAGSGDSSSASDDNEGNNSLCRLLYRELS
jgi:hypothetical protein